MHLLPIYYLCTLTTLHVFNIYCTYHTFQWYHTYHTNFDDTYHCLSHLSHIPHIPYIWNIITTPTIHTMPNVHAIHTIPTLHSKHSMPIIVTIHTIQAIHTVISSIPYPTDLHTIPTIHTIPTLHVIYTIRTIHTKHTIHSKHAIPDRHTHHTYPTYHTTPPPHHRGGRGQYYGWPMTMAGGGRLERWTIYIYIYIFFRLYIILYLSQHEALGSHPKILSSVRFFRDFQQGTRTTEDEPMGDTPRQVVSGSISKVDDGGKAPHESLIQSMVSCHISDMSVELCKTIWYIMISWMIDILWYNTI